jgi:tellurite resistance protein
MNKRNILRWVVVCVLLVLAVGLVWSRAGGGGGSDSSGDGGDGIGAIVWMIIQVLIYLPFPLNLIVIAVIIGIGLLVARAKKRASILNKMPDGRPVSKVKGYDKFLAANPGFNADQFFQKVRQAFIAIQDAWQKQDLSTVRRFISDGVWQRYEAQFRMMRALKQKNIIEKLEILNVSVDRIDLDGSYDIVHVAVHASIVDRFICETDASLNSGGKEEFVEYWSFLKKRGVEAKDMYSKPACPNCGGDLSGEAGESTKCPYCGSITNSGAFDWVLSEITQADDYIGIHPRMRATENLTDKVADLVGESDDFAVQLIEDKASNGYLQLLIGRAFRDPTMFRRFTSNEVFEKEESAFDQRNLLYNRLYLNDVSLLSARRDGKKNILALAMRASYQRVILHENGQAEKIDQGVLSRTEVILMSRDADAGVSQGSLYAHNCPNCGGPLENVMDISCKWCGAVLNSTSREWIITGLMQVHEYEQYVAEHKSEFTFRIAPSLLEKAYDVRDFAFNNVLVMVAVDGKIEQDEVAFVYEIAKKWGYNSNMVANMIQQASSLSVRMPEGLKQREKVFAMMEKAAYADGRVDESEQRLLESVVNEYLKPLREQAAGEEAAS